MKVFVLMYNVEHEFNEEIGVFVSVDSAKKHFAENIMPTVRPWLIKEWEKEKKTDWEPLDFNDNRIHLSIGVLESYSIDEEEVRE